MQLMNDQLATADIIKVDETLGLVFGWAIVCKENGEDHFDLQGHHIPEEVMMKAVADFAQSDRVSLDMHEGDPGNSDDMKAQVVFMFPLTEEVAKSFNILTDRTGLMIAVKPNNPATLAKYASGEYKGFSIGGQGILKDAA